MFRGVNNGLFPVRPDHRDYHFLPSFGASQFDVQGLPADFSIYSGELIPNQDDLDGRFKPPLPALLYGCTGECGAFSSGLEDGKLYNPQYLYDHTPPYVENTGRQMRDMLDALCNGGLQDDTGKPGVNRTAYFNVYGSGSIDDFDAMRIAIYLNQQEKRSVIVGSYWYLEFAVPQNGILPTPSFDTLTASQHAWVVTGWKTINGTLYAEVISWQGMQYGTNGIVYMSRDVYNALMEQPWTGAFTIATIHSGDPVTLGIQAYVDHVVYFIRNLFRL